ncbi:hypothetical protein [Streptosporangium jomthongense]|uniref:Uncharacterized protein n=1 Tax=Streptosporangium jomthongense TaxID=1193683 RepID=A0ABV8FC00_9ACTN
MGGLPPWIERPDLPVRVPYDRQSRLVADVLRPLWLSRREWAFGLLVLTLAMVGRAAGGWPGALVAVGLLAAVLLGPPPMRRWTLRVFRHARVRRRWDKACRFAGLTTSNGRIPRITKVMDSPAGERVRVRMPGGLAVPDLEERGEHIAADLEVRDVRIRRDPENARFAAVEIVRRDPLGSRGVLAWPWRDAWRTTPVVSMWEPFPVAVGEDGAVLTVSWFDDNHEPGDEEEPA